MKKNTEMGSHKQKIFSSPNEIEEDAGECKENKHTFSSLFYEKQIYQVCNRGLDICNSQIQSILQNRNIPTLFRIFF